MNRLFDLEEEVTRVKNRGQQSRLASMQLAIETAYITKTDKGGAYLHTFETDAKGNITSVGKSMRGRIPTGERISVDTGKIQSGFGGHIWARFKGKTGAIKREHVAVLPTSFDPAIVLRSDVIVTDSGVKVEQGTKLWSTVTSFDQKTGLDTFVESVEIKSLPIGTSVNVQPQTRGAHSIWAMLVSGNDYTFGAVDGGHVLLASQAQYPFYKPFSIFFQACRTKPWFNALFRGYAKKVSALENLDFLNVVPQIKNKVQAQKTLDYFVTNKAKTKLNLPGNMKNSLINSIEKPSQDYPDWRVPFGYDESRGTNFKDHLIPNGACIEVWKMLADRVVTTHPEMRDPNKRKEYISELTK